MVKHIVKPSVVETYVKEVTGCTDRASLEEWQLGRVREMIRYAKKRSRFYTEHLKGVEPEQIRSSADLRGRSQSPAPGLALPSGIRRSEDRHAEDLGNGAESEAGVLFIERTAGDTELFR